MRLANSKFIFAFKTERISIFFFEGICFLGGLKIIKCIAEETKARICGGGLKSKIVF